MNSSRKSHSRQESQEKVMAWYFVLGQVGITRSLKEENCGRVRVFSGEARLWEIFQSGQSVVCS